MKLLACETVVKEAFSVAARPLASLAFATIRYLVPRSSWAPGFQDVPSDDMAPATSLPDSASVSFTSVSLPPVAFTPVSLMLALVAPSSDETLILTSEAFLAAAASAPAWPFLPSSLPPAEASPPQADRVSALAANRAVTASVRRIRR